ncbi:hypothetical protein EVAR_74933_1 [Eumeta japonica]|uniref:Uncharacterized protein n=1 Tax=Eumeta variegata TaxID=151549 RepID=A0A4C1UI75_EUMVA|nr:hypothetical protein EVAR_74933_1 [Eumeta japonica]
MLTCFKFNRGSAPDSDLDHGTDSDPDSILDFNTGSTFYVDSNTGHSLNFVPAGDGHRPIIGAHIPCKRCKPSPAAVQQTQTTSTASVESTRNPVSASTQAVTAKTAPRTGAKPTAPPRPKLPPPIFCAKALPQISADCTRLRINYSKAVRTADDGIKIHCPDVETFRSLNISWTSKSNFTYALEEERKLKAVIRGIPTDFPVDEIQADLCGQGFLCTRCTDFAAETAHHYG